MPIIAAEQFIAKLVADKAFAQEFSKEVGAKPQFAALAKAAAAKGFVFTESEYKQAEWAHDKVQVDSWFEKVRSDKALSAAMKAHLSKHEGVERVTALVDFAAKHGFRFSAFGYVITASKHVEERRKAQSGDKLTDAELAQVAGGAGYVNGPNGSCVYDTNATVGIPGSYSCDNGPSVNIPGPNPTSSQSAGCVVLNTIQYL